MKSLKIFLAVTAIFIASSSLAQSKYKEINFSAKGTCGMCEKRIENALDLKGIKLADWDVKTHNCRVIYNTQKYNEMDIHKIVAKFGHTTDKVKATDEAYNNLHGCCKYDG